MPQLRKGWKRRDDGRIFERLGTHETGMDSTSPAIALLYDNRAYCRLNLGYEWRFGLGASADCILSELMYANTHDTSHTCKDTLK